jgi:hypothetical protein
VRLPCRVAALSGAALATRRKNILALAIGYDVEAAFEKPGE